MFGSFTDMFKLLGNLNKVAKEYQRQLEELKEKTVEASVAADQVKAIANGLGQIKSIKIAPELIQSADVEMIEELTVSAVNAAIEKSRLLAQEQLGQMANLLPMGDLKEIFGKLQKGTDGNTSGDE